ncbi:FkbM family methyltransferase [Mesorhizobium caraganae]|uniref:FkbM family methyltransferase n=1 Tax=Mesorhizobium caraganae TaxID=483206 RepID=UPI00193983B3|nr:FkbM family methyltransferase [Mesorhizobium caraganae]MBM2714230.1 FkbM family methyltransferase [Mesorhizobium caraganae]
MGEVIFSQTYSGDGLSRWQVAHEMSIRLEDGALVVSDTERHSWHLLRLHDPAFLFRIVRVKCRVKFCVNCTTNFYIHHYGSIDVAEISPNGNIVDNGISISLSVDHVSKDVFDIDVHFLNLHPTLSVGCSNNCKPVYSGTGHEQFVLMSVLVETFDANAELSSVPAEERITIVDVGGQGGLQIQWMLRADRITPMVFEPIPSEAAAIRETLGRIPGAQVIEKALAHATGTQKLHIAASSDCSSLRAPNIEVLQRYSIGRLFTTIGTQEVECVRFDEFFRTQSAPSPDMVKIDVQGFEYEVLIGFGRLLESCLAIELETHVTPIYIGQKLLCDIVSLLDDFGFSLRKINEIKHFDGDAIEFDAVFTKRRERIMASSEPVKRKFAAISDALGLAPYS